MIKTELNKFFGLLAYKYACLAHENVLWQIKNQDLKDTYAYAASDLISDVYALISSLFFSFTEQGRVWKNDEEKRKGKL